MKPGRYAPPTGPQVAAFLALAEHRTFAKATAALGFRSEASVRRQVAAFLWRTSLAEARLVTPRPAARGPVG